MLYRITLKPDTDVLMQTYICICLLYTSSAKDQIEQFDYLFGRYPADFLGLCIDTGHANLVGGNEFIKLLATRYADRFFCQHLHDNKMCIRDSARFVSAHT